PLPYHHKDIIIKNDTIAIGGTLTWPKDKKAKQLVIMISGSGAQDRDESLPITDFEPFATLADSLTTAGLATFRYDDRGVNKSTGDFAETTLDMLASDVETIIEYFTNKSDHIFDQIILLGHSQGGIVGGKVATKDAAVDKLILMASTGVKLKKVIHFQVRRALAQNGFSQKQIEKEFAARQELYEALKQQKNVKEAKNRYSQALLNSLQKIAKSQQNAEDLHQAAQQETKSLIASYTTPQFRSLYSYVPTKDLQRLDIPVLVLFGGKDTQVSVEMNKAPI